MFKKYDQYYFEMMADETFKPEFPAEYDVLIIEYFNLRWSILRNKVIDRFIRKSTRVHNQIYKEEERLKMYRKLNEKELQWIDRLMDVEFQGRDILLQQLSKAKIIYIQGYAYISIKFKVEGDIELYPYHVRVPVVMRAFQQSSVPIMFLIHIINGIIDELEILTADSTQIDTDNIELERVEYEINQEVIMKK